MFDYLCEGVGKLVKLSDDVITEAATGGVLQEKMFLEISQISQENTCARVYFFYKKETLAQVFSGEFCEISKNTFFTEHLWATASVINHVIHHVK